LKYLYLIRHAKAEPFIEGTEDHNRKLVNKGEQRAADLAYWLSKKTPIIQELHFSSSIGPFCPIQRPFCPIQRPFGP
jgi:phosphohistidine phosphatase SixA